MASIFTTHCWFEIEGKTYGPADCEIVEDVEMASHGTTGMAFSGIFALTRNFLPLVFDPTNARVRLEDGRHGRVMFSKLVNGITGTFRVLGDLEQPVS